MRAALWIGFAVLGEVLSLRAGQPWDALVREQITAGKSDAQVLDYVVERYGQYVLLKPRFEPETLILWGTPFAVLLIAGAAMILRRKRAVVTPETPLSEDEKRALERAMQ